MDRRRVLSASRADARRLAGQQVRAVTPSRRDFAQYVATQKTALAVIARLACPEAARWSAAELIAHARACDDAEVAALAVVTGVGGLSMADLAAIADATTAPILRDDLIIDRSQLYDARLHGADAVMFPAAELDDATLRELVTVASSLHMASVIEVLEEADVGVALRLPHVILGLRCTQADGRLDVTGTQQLAQGVSRQRTVIVLPEVSVPAECAALSGLCDAVLIGDALHAAHDIAATVQQLTGN